MPRLDLDRLPDRTGEEGRFVVIGARTATETARYSDEDMKFVVDGTGARFTRKDGAALGGSARQGEET